MARSRRASRRPRASRREMRRRSSRSAGACAWRCDEITRCSCSTFASCCRLGAPTLTRRLSSISVSTRSYVTLLGKCVRAEGSSRGCVRSRATSPLSANTLPYARAGGHLPSVVRRVEAFLPPGRSGGIPSRPDAYDNRTQHYIARPHQRQTHLLSRRYDFVALLYPHLRRTDPYVLDC